MRKLLFLLLTAVTTTLGCQAVNVTTTAGGLSQAVDDASITTLSVSGTLDARDFLFMTNELNELTMLDLSQATILPYDRGVALYGALTRYMGNEIPRTAFFGKKLRSVVLPANLEYIGYAAFAGCYQLTSITIPESVVYIDDYAFSGSALTSVVVPATVTTMGKGVFSRCEALQSARIEAGSIDKFAFLGDVQLSQVEIGPSVSYIGEGAFNGCTALKTLAVATGSRISRIGAEAFINSGLESLDIINLPVGTIGDWALAQTHLSSIALTDGMTELGKGALAHNPQLTSVSLPGLGHENGGARHGAPGRTRTIDQIDDYTFAGDALLNAGSMIKQGITRIGDYAFYNVSAAIDTMRLPSSIEYLGTRAMAGMTGMQVLKTDAATVPALGEEVWAGVDQPSIPLITIDDQAKALYKDADQWMNFFFQAPAYILGDVNGDGSVSIDDVTALIDYLLGTGTIDMLAADLDQSGTISIDDVTALIDYLLTGSANMSLQRIKAQARARYATTSDMLEAESITLSAGQTRTIDVSLDNAEDLYAAMQCEIVLPEGVKLTDVKGIDRGAGHSCYFVQHKGETNVYTLISVSMDHSAYSGNNGKVLTLTVGADEDFNSADVVITNVRLVNLENAIRLADDAISRINNTSGIEQVNADKQVASVRYINVAGQESESPFTGVNIVVTTYTDGTMTTTKVMK
ncbi:MAG: leucine-rich repeat protein [Muribaculaceae bacterium]|nr:leucine-rich repeat protein [Muribaculaceae bacterium]